MIKAIIKDFEIIEEAKIVIDGITALTGESHNGKTATYNSLRVLAYNVQGRSYIRRVNGKEVPQGCKISLLLDDSVAVSFSKSDSLIYTITKGDHTLKLDKVGRGGTPKEVSDLLNMTPLDADGTAVNLNFMDQMSEPLLKKLSEFQLYKVAVKSFDGEKIQEAISICKTDTDAKQTEFKKKESEIEIQKRNRLYIVSQLDTYSKIDPFINALPEYDKAKALYDKLLLLQKSLYDIEKNLLNIEYALHLMKPILVLEQDLIDMSKVEYDLSSLTDLRSDYTSYSNVLKGIESNLNTLSKSDIFIENKSKYMDAVHKFDVLMSAQETLNVAEDNLRVNSRILSHLELDFKDIQQRFEDYRKNSVIVSNLVSLNIDYVGILSNIDNVNSTCAKLNSLPEVKDYISTVSKLSTLEGIKDRFLAATETLTMSSNEVARINDELSVLNKMNEEGICPLCGEVCNNHN